MKLILCRHPSAGSYLLRAYMGSRWSHAAVWDDADGYVYDSTLMQGGVMVTNEWDFFSRYSAHRVIDLQVDDVEGARSWLRAQLGKGYDWSALIGILFRTEAWEDDDRWFCSEMCAAFINAFCGRMFEAHTPRITPYHLDLLTDKAYDLK